MSNTARNIDSIKNTKPSTTKVSMNLTNRDMDNVDYLTDRLNARNQVIAVSRALEVARQLISNIDDGQTLLLKSSDGDLKEVQILF